jgi:hypothetical protein
MAEGYFRYTACIRKGRFYNNTGLSLNLGLFPSDSYYSVPLADLLLV